jgi:hypothetical protein
MPSKIKPHIKTVKWMGWKPDTPDGVNDHEFNPTWLKGATVEPPRKHFLPAKFMPPVRDQGNQGSCTGHMAYGMAAYVHLYCGQPLPNDKLSPRFAYWNARVLEGSTKEDSGAEIRDAIKGVVKWGISTERLCPYNPKNWSRPPGTTAFKNALGEMITDYARIPDGDINGIRIAISGDFPVGFGFSCYANLDDDRVTNQGILGMPSGALDGGHAVWICGYDDDMKIDNETGAVLIQNSWGTQWGCQPEGYASRGFFWMPYAYVTNKNLADDFWVTRKIT